MKLPNDKKQHVIACGLIAFTVAVMVSLITHNYMGGVIAGVSSGLSAGFAKEYGDKQCSKNRWDWQDIIADAVGSIFGALIGATPSLML